MNAPATFAIVISTPLGIRYLADPSEREIAGTAEAVLRAVGADVRLSSFTVRCADAGAFRRLTAYLREIVAEMLVESKLGRHPPVIPISD